MIESIAQTLNGRLLPRPGCLLEVEGGQVALLVGSGVAPLSPGNMLQVRASRKTYTYIPQ